MGSVDDASVLGLIWRLTYRARQFFSALTAPLAKEDLRLAQQQLTPAQWALFLRMSPSDRRHGLAVCRALQAQGPQPADLLVAALLHDVGKGGVPSAIWVRVATVFLERCAPRRVERLERESAPGWMRAVVAYRQHARRGAEWAAEAGCSSTTVDLIRRHETPADPESDPLLARLQAADDSW